MNWDNTTPIDPINPETTQRVIDKIEGMAGKQAPIDVSPEYIRPVWVSAEEWVELLSGRLT